MAEKKRFVRFKSGYNPKTTCPTCEQPWDATMTLRDYFAAAAMRGVCWTDNKDDQSQIAKVCYDIADAMLKAREEPCES